MADRPRPDWRHPAQPAFLALALAFMVIGITGLVTRTTTFVAFFVIGCAFVAIAYAPPKPKTGTGATDAAPRTDDDGRPGA